MAKVPMAKTVYRFEFRYLDLFRAWSSGFNYVAIVVKERIPSRLRTGGGQVFEWGIAKCYNSVEIYKGLDAKNIS